MTKKRFLLALALMLTAVGGAWAQGHQKYTSAVSYDNLQPGDTLCEGASITGSSYYMVAFASGRYTTTATDNYFFMSANPSFGEGGVITLSNSSTFTPKDENGNTGDAWVVTEDPYNLTLAGITMPVAEPLLNWNAATKTGSLTTPAGNVTLTVDYYGQYTLDSVPTAEGWQVKVNGTLATVTPYTTGSALGHVDNINETDSVELLPPAELRGTIKAVRLTESVAAPAVVEPITVTWNSTALSAMAMSFVSGSQSRTQDDVTVTMTASGGPMTFGSMMDVNGTGNFVFSTELGNITQIVISFSDGGDWTGANAGWPSELYTYGAGTFTWSGTPASSVTLSSDGASNINGITSIVFTIQPNN